MAPKKLQQTPIRRDSRLNTMEDMLLVWIKDRIRLHKSLTFKLIQKHALFLWKDLQATPSRSSRTQQSFVASKSWFKSFRERAGIHIFLSVGSDVLDGDDAQVRKLRKNRYGTNTLQGRGNLPSVVVTPLAQIELNSSGTQPSNKSSELPQRPTVQLSVVSPATSPTVMQDFVGFGTVTAVSDQHQAEPETNGTNQEAVNEGMSTSASEVLVGNLLLDEKAVVTCTEENSLSVGAEDMKDSKEDGEEEESFVPAKKRRRRTDKDKLAISRTSDIVCEATKRVKRIRKPLQEKTKPSEGGYDTMKELSLDGDKQYENLPDLIDLQQPQESTKPSERAYDNVKEHSLDDDKKDENSSDRFDPNDLKQPQESTKPSERAYDNEKEHSFDDDKKYENSSDRPDPNDLKQPQESTKQSERAYYTMKEHSLYKGKKDDGPDPIDLFFQSVAVTVKKLTPYYQNVCKSKVFSVVSEVEMKQILDQGSLVASAMPTL